MAFLQLFFAVLAVLHFKFSPIWIFTTLVFHLSNFNHEAVLQTYFLQFGLSPKYFSPQIFSSFFFSPKYFHHFGSSPFFFTQIFSPQWLFILFFHQTFFLLKVFSPQMPHVLNSKGWSIFLWYLEAFYWSMHKSKVTQNPKICIKPLRFFDLIILCALKVHFWILRFLRILNHNFQRPI